MEPPIYSVDSTRPLPAVRTALEAACASRGFGVLGVHDLGAKLAEKGFPLGESCVLYEICSPPVAKRAIEADARLAAVLPCRVALTTEKGGRVRLSTIRPTVLVKLFDGPEVDALAREVQLALGEILAEAARPD
jgi:uncharacterized protein (DUF302 family)